MRIAVVYLPWLINDSVREEAVVGHVYSKLVNAAEGSQIIFWYEKSNNPALQYYAAKKKQVKVQKYALLKVQLLQDSQKWILNHDAFMWNTLRLVLWMIYILSLKLDFALLMWHVCTVFHH